MSKEKESPKKYGWILRPLGFELAYGCFSIDPYTKLVKNTPIFRLNWWYTPIFSTITKAEVSFLLIWAQDTIAALPKSHQAIFLSNRIVTPRDLSISSIEDVDIDIQIPIIV
jgi:hypothetical protein